MITRKGGIQKALGLAGAATLCVVAAGLAQAQVKQGKTRALKTGQLMKVVVKPSCDALKKGLENAPASAEAWDGLAANAAVLNEVSYLLLDDGRCPDGVWADPTWVGKTSHGTLSGDQAMKAVELAGAFTDVVNTTAKSMNLYGDGYGITGVCNDSVAVIQQAMTGHADEYPLLMKDEVLYGALKQHLNDHDADVGLYQQLSKAIHDLPSDATPNRTAKARALASLSWAPGNEPFQSTADARKILSQ